MFFPSCKRLADREPTLASLIQRIDDALASMGPAGEIVVSDLAYIVEEVPEQVETVLDELVDLGGLERQDRLFCENGCFSITPEEYQTAVAEGEVVQCVVCNTRLRAPPASIKSVYLLRELSSQLSPRAASVPPGKALRPGGRYTMLFAAANPQVKQSLALEQEWRRIEQRFCQKQCVVEIQKVDRWATTTSDLRQALFTHCPTIVHFSGHGTKQRGLNFANDTGQVQRVRGRALAGLFKLFDSIECVVLNTCHSADQAGPIAKHIHCVIAMQGEIGDDAAIEFSAGFYDALTAGQPFGRCFEIGLNALDLADLTDIDCPSVWIDGINYPVMSGN